MIALSLVGCGGHARLEHAPALARYVVEHPGEIELAAACDPEPARAEALSREFGFARTYRSTDELLRAEKLGGAVCTVPVKSILEVSSQFLERGIPCIIEKPLGDSLAEAEQLTELARRTGTPHLVSVNRRFIPLLNRAVAWAHQAGPLRFIRASMIRSGRRERDFLWSTAIHAVDTCRYLAGEVESCDILVHNPAESHAAWAEIAFVFAGGCLGQLTLLPTAGMVEERYELCGDRYRACFSTNWTHTRLVCWLDGDVVVDEAAPPEEHGHVTGGLYAETVEFITALHERRMPRPTLAEVLPSMRLCLRIAEIANASTKRMTLVKLAEEDERGDS